MEAIFPLKESNMTTANVDYTTVGCSLSKGSAREEDLDAKLKKLDIQKILSSVIRNQDMETVKHEFSCEEEYVLFKLLSKGTKELVDIKRLIKESEEEEIEFGFERVAENLDQHRVHCPNCNSRITKVVLRKPRTVESLGLFGCLSCLSILFSRGGNIESSHQTSVVAANRPSSFTDDNGITEIDQRGTCFDLSWIFKNDQTPELISAESSYVTKEKESLVIDQQGPDDRENMEKHEIARMDTSYDLDIEISDPNNCPLSQEGSLSPVACKTEVLTDVTIAHQDAGKHTSTSINGVVPSGAVTINIEGESDGNIMKEGSLSKKPASRIGEMQSIEAKTTEGTSASGTTPCTEPVTDESKPIPLVETKGSKALEILKSIVYGGLMESIETLRIPSLKLNSELDIATDLVSQLNWIKLKHKNINIARLKGELSVEQGKHRLLPGNEQVNSLQSRVLLHWGSVNLESLVTALQKMGINASVEQGTSGTESECFVRVESNKALIEINATGTVISTADEKLASLIFEAIRSSLDGG